MVLPPDCLPATAAHYVLQLHEVQDHGNLSQDTKTIWWFGDLSCVKNLKNCHGSKVVKENLSPLPILEWMTSSLDRLQPLPTDAYTEPGVNFASELTYIFEFTYKVQAWHLAAQPKLFLLGGEGNILPYTNKYFNFSVLPYMKVATGGIAKVSTSD